jgi:hypothetical protein
MEETNLINNKKKIYRHKKKGNAFFDVSRLTKPSKIGLDEQKTSFVRDNKQCLQNDENFFRSLVKYNQEQKQLFESSLIRRSAIIEKTDNTEFEIIADHGRNRSMDEEI